MPDFVLSSPPASRQQITSGARIVVRGALWMVRRVEQDGACRHLHCIGLDGISQGKATIFIDLLESDLKIVEPADVDLTYDLSPGYADTKLYLEAALRSAPQIGDQPHVLGAAAIDDLPFQHEPVRRAIKQPRIRLLLADDVGLGKTLQAGLVCAELTVRKRAQRVLVVTTRAMLTQFQKEFWTRFSIPLARLDSAAIRRMRNSIPATYNVFDQFDRAIVSVDTLKKDSQYRIALEQSRWDLVIIDEAHNVAERRSARAGRNQRARLANLLASRADALLLLTATPHDGSASSFSSLVRMLDGTRVPDPDDLRRPDIEDLVIRRFRSSPEVMRDIRKSVPERVVSRRPFRLDPTEDAVLHAIAELKLDMDEQAQGKVRAIDLFKTTLAKSAFSSPAACLETVGNRLKRIEAGQARGSEQDIAALQKVRSSLALVGPENFKKYTELGKLLQELKWTGRDKRDRLVIFSERIATLNWLHERLASDLGLPAGAVVKVDGSRLESDEDVQKALEDFGQASSPIRILLASDVASEGLNLHFQCHRLIHFDLPWSLLRFQQRNGRIDRYGQDRRPEIYYFVGESTHERVRDMWVVDKLIEKDDAAQLGIGDPAVFLAVGDPDEEEAQVAEAVASGRGAEAFGALLNANAAKADTSPAGEWDLLFGDYQDKTKSESSDVVATPPPAARLFPSTFAFCARMLERLSEGDAGPVVNESDRLITLALPDELRTADAFGYVKEGQVDEQYMPVEVVGRNEQIELTDSKEMVDAAIQRARAEERSWPTVQYLWDAHPILGWLNDRALRFFPSNGAPMVRPSKGLLPAEVAVLLHGTITSRSGRAEIDQWCVVRMRDGQVTERKADVRAFLTSIGFLQDTPNRGAPTTDSRPDLSAAVRDFQDSMVELRKARQIELTALAADVRKRLEPFRSRFAAQLELNFSRDGHAGSSIQKRRDALKRRREGEVNELFKGWEDWIAETCVLPDDPNPFVEVKAVFRG